MGREREGGSLALQPEPWPAGFVLPLSFVLRKSSELLRSLVLAPSLVRQQGYIDVLEDLSGSDAENAVA